MRLRDVAHGDRRIGRRPETAAGDRTDDRAIAAADFRMGAHRRTALRLDANELSRRAVAELFLNDFSAGEAALLAPALGDRPNKSRLYGRRRLIDVVAV